MCSGKLSETDEDGVTLSHGYNSAKQQVETIRPEIRDGETLITPETITTYTRDALGRVLQTRRDVGAMTTTESTTYDFLGRVVSQTDALGRTTSTEYSEDGLTATVTTPAGATFITTRNLDGSIAHEYGTGQRELYHVYDIIGNRLRETVTLADHSTILSQTLHNGFGQVVVRTIPTTVGYMYERSEYNAKGQLVKAFRDTGARTASMAPTLYEYDAFGDLTKQTLLLDASAPTDVTKNRMVLQAHSVEKGEDGVFAIRTTTSYTARGNALTTTSKSLISQMSASIESKSVSVDVCGNTSTQWTEFGSGTQRISKSTVPTSAITAQALSVDGFTTTQTDHHGITTSATRHYSATGVSYTHTDGRGNTSTTVTDIAGRTLSVADAAGNTTTTIYDTNFDQPSIVTDALGKTACYKYDIRGRKVAEFGTAIQPALFGYDDADRMTSLTTFRVDSGDITTDPSNRLDGDTTTWAYHNATGLETSKTYADGSSIRKYYGIFRQLATVTNARGIVQTRTYDAATGQLTGISFSDATEAQTFAYNVQGQLVQVSDAAGTRNIDYDAYGQAAADSITVEGREFSLAEHYDPFGRSSGYQLMRGLKEAQSVSYGYDESGRLNRAAFRHKGQWQKFTYTREVGSNLLRSIACPNGITKTYGYDEHRDLVTSIIDTRAEADVVTRLYTYDALGRPTTRSYTREGIVRNDTFTHNDRSELIAATMGNDSFSYDYDNVGNRKVSTEKGETTVYDSNELNQYIAENEFVPEFDADGNQILVKTGTGIWAVTYNALNRPTQFTRTAEDGTITTVTAAYDYMGRRVFKKVEENGTVTLHQRYLYRGYLQIAALDLTRSTLSALWFITWDPTEQIATRPLAIQKNGTWYTYGLDLTKNVMEIYDPFGHIRTFYTYTPFGEVTASGDVAQGGLDKPEGFAPQGRAADGAAVSQPIQWSSEYNDTELGMVYYNFRHYNPIDGRWTGKDPIGLDGEMNLYGYIENKTINQFDYLGLIGLPKNDLEIGKEYNKYFDEQFAPNLYSAKYGSIWIQDSNIKPEFQRIKLSKFIKHHGSKMASITKDVISGKEGTKCDFLDASSKMLKGFADVAATELTKRGSKYIFNELSKYYPDFKNNNIIPQLNEVIFGKSPQNEKSIFSGSVDLVFKVSQSIYDKYGTTISYKPFSIQYRDSQGHTEFLPNSMKTRAGKCEKEIKASANLNIGIGLHFKNWKLEGSLNTGISTDSNRIQSGGNIQIKINF